MTGRTLFFTICIASVALVLGSGCRLRARGYVATPPPPTVEVQAHGQVSSPPPQTVHVQVGQPQFGAGVTVIEASCQQGAAEVCNGLDDNCNGQIDEGCGYSSGAIQITLAWATGADLDLYVTDPSGETLSYSNTQISTGGYLDQDARGACRSTQPNNTIENVYWNTPQPPRGNYQVTVHYWGECNSNAGPTSGTLAIAIGGQLWRSLQFSLAPNQRETLASFQL
jgi:hypothetical protein